MTWYNFISAVAAGLSLAGVVVSWTAHAYTDPRSGVFAVVLFSLVFGLTIAGAFSFVWGA